MLRKKRLSVLIIFLFLFQLIRSQDIVYLNSGDKFEAIIKEINSSAVKYKNFTNPDGPTYVINKSEVLMIEYKNGTLDIINKTPVSISPAKTETVVPKKQTKKEPYELYYSNKNCLYFNGLALANSDLAFIYDREIAKSRLSIVLLGAYNFNVHTNYTNRYLQAVGISKKNFDVGAGINFYTQTRRKSQYFVGLLFKYMDFNYVRETTTEQIINGTPHLSVTTQNVHNYQFASMIVNGLQFRMNPFFTYRIFIGVGFTNKDTDITKAVKEDLKIEAQSLSKAYLGMCVGYRFY